LCYPMLWWHTERHGYYMMASNPYKTYKDQDLDTSNPREIVGKLFGAASVSLRRAVLEINNKHIEKANECILKAENIIEVLDKSLDMEFPISAQMHDLYDYMIRRMIEANVKKDIGILIEIAGLISELRETWEEAFSLSVKNRL
jgi:flagellar protein FliS